MTNWLMPRIVMEEALKEYTTKERPTKMHDLITKRSWCSNEPTVVKTGDAIPLNWSHEASEKLGKVKKVDIRDDLVSIELLSTAPGREWIDKLKDYIFEEENRYRREVLFAGGKNKNASEEYRKQAAEIILGARYESDAIDACRYAFENLKLSLRSAQDQEIAKYSVKDKSELMTPYDIWEQNKKGELPMNTYDVTYNEKKAAAQKAYDEAMIEAKKEKEAAAQKEANENAAKTLKGMYDAYVNAGFTPEQAEKFVTIALEKVAGKI